MGRWAGGDRLGSGGRQTRAGHRRISERHRSGPRREVRFPQRAESALAWSWFRDNPVGFNGVPFVLFKTILDLDPNHENPTLRAIARIWKREAIVPAGSGTAASAWTFDHIGIGPNPSDYVDGVARPASERQSPLPFGFAFENPRVVRAAVGGRDRSSTTAGCWRGASFRTRVC